MLVVIAPGGNASLRRGEARTAENQSGRHSWGRSLWPRRKTTEREVPADRVR
jgi:hypothetical protein